MLTQQLAIGASAELVIHHNIASAGGGAAGACKDETGKWAAWRTLQPHGHIVGAALVAAKARTCGSLGLNRAGTKGGWNLVTTWLGECVWVRALCRMQAHCTYKQVWLDTAAGVVAGQGIPRVQRLFEGSARGMSWRRYKQSQYCGPRRALGRMQNAIARMDTSGSSQWQAVGAAWPMIQVLHLMWPALPARLRGARYAACQCTALVEGAEVGVGHESQVTQ